VLSVWYSRVCDIPSRSSLGVNVLNAAVDSLIEKIPLKAPLFSKLPSSELSLALASVSIAVFYLLSDFDCFLKGGPVVKPSDFG